MFILGLLLTIASIFVVGYLSNKKTNDSYSFYKGAVSVQVSGALIGTLVGGSSTIGTAQLAYNYGFSAWWFTLGGGLGVLLLLIFYYPLKKKNVSTLADVIAIEYGNKASVILALLNSVGTFLSFVAQIISGSALIMSVTSLNFSSSVIIVSLLIILYVIFGGQKALGNAGLAKTIILSISILVCGIFVITSLGGFNAYLHSDLLEHNKYFNLFARGVFTDLGAGISLLIGVVTTQSYISAILSAKSDKTAIGGTILTAIIVPLIGVAGIFVGLYMKQMHPYIDPKIALPTFILENMPPFISGIMIASLLIAVVGTGSGLVFGMSSMLYKNVFKSYFINKNNTIIIRTILIIIVVVGSILCLANLSDLILGWSFMSMGLRGAVAFIPMLFALFLPGKIRNSFAIASMIFGVLFTLIGKIVLPSYIDPMFLGLGSSMLVALIGIIANKKYR